jgi:hypothetical protein
MAQMTRWWAGAPIQDGLRFDVEDAAAARRQVEYLRANATALRVTQVELVAGGITPEQITAAAENSDRWADLIENGIAAASAPESTTSD